MCKELNLNILGNYYDLYVQGNKLLLVDLFGNLETNVMKYMMLTMVIFYELQN